MGDAYQAPAVCSLHALARAGNANVTTTGGTLVTPKARMLDGRLDRRTRWPSAGASYEIRVDRGLAVVEPVDRIVISDHNLTGMRFAVVTDTNQNGAWSALTTVLPYSRVRGSSVVNALRTFLPGVNVIDFPANSARYIGLYIEGDGSTVPEIGEVILTRKWVPTMAPQPGYQPTVSPNLLVFELASRKRRVLELGDPRREWAIGTYALSGADRLILENVLRGVGYGRDLFVFDPPSGGYETTIDTFEGFSGGGSISTWTQVNATATAQTGFDALGHCAEVVSSGTSPASIQRVFATALNLKGCVFRVAQKAATRAYASAGDGWRIFLGTSGHFSRWDYGTSKIRADGQWYQVAIDLDLDTPSARSGDGCDPANVTFIGLQSVVSAGSQATSWDDLHFVRKDRAPAIVHVEPEIDVVQAANVPQGPGGEHMRFGLRLVEAA